MNKLLIITLAYFATYSSANSQPVIQYKKDAEIKKTFSNKKEFLSDSVFIKSISKLYNASSFTNLLNSADSLNLITHKKEGEFVSSNYIITFSIKPIGWTNDFENILTEDQIKILDITIDSFEIKTGNEIAIVTIDSSWIAPNAFDSLILAIGNNWGVGKKNINNGIVIGISSGLRKIRISNGYGIEKKLSDNQTQSILQEFMIPEFKNGNFYQGIWQGLQALMDKIK